MHAARMGMHEDFIRADNCVRLLLYDIFSVMVAL